jgi:hypothetical protein
MTKVRMDKMLPGQALEIVRELREKGYVTGIDFDFTYYPSVNDRFTGPTKPCYTIFTFHKESLATWFTLRYQ